ncbi:MAG TPA: SpoIID/LytB domain-containing protein [Longimicrobiales bacterium]|nr:SpoIID/LytB domain-containing protein [Longimicrobiales bacterium]
MRHLRSRSLTAALATAALFTAACEQTPFTPTEAPADYARIDAAPSRVEYTGAIRIGVVPTASSVTIGAAGPWELVEKATGNVVLTGAGGSLDVTIETPATIVTVYRLQVACYGSAALASWEADAQAKGYTTWTEFVPAANCTRARLVYPSSNTSFSARTAFLNQAIADGVAFPGAFWTTGSQISAAVLKVVGASTVLVNEAAILRSTSGQVTINGAAYRGIAEVAPNSGGTLAGINSLPMEDYLYGVVPRELPPTVYGELEALKAQAVAARTYAMRGLGKRAANGYDLLPTTSDQVYGGLAAEHPLSTQAVDETAGIVASYNGALIEALYSSTSGGFTASNEEVYNSAPVAYLRGVPDAQRGQAFDRVPTLEVFKRSANPRSLRGYKAGDFEADWSRYHRWSFEWTAEEISGALSAWRGIDVGTVHAINVLDRGPSGRVLHIQYVTDAGTFESTKDAIRTSLKFINASGGYSSMLSTLFYIEPVVDRNTGEIGFAAWGGGWGHGVGLSQTGAVGMAEKKATYEEILKHYYQGIALELAY